MKPALLLVLALALGAIISACGGSHGRPVAATGPTPVPLTGPTGATAGPTGPTGPTTSMPTGPTGPTSSPPNTPASSPAGLGEQGFGITEDNPDLLAGPGAPVQPPAGFDQARDELAALHPTYVRLIVDWAVLQPNPGQPPDLEGQVDGCAREIGPCGPYRGLRDELAAIAGRQREGGEYQVVLNIYGVPPWAARSPSGCEEPYESTGVARALRRSAIADYKALIHSIALLGEQEGVPLQWWNPWNEPNSAEFLAPQRARCSLRSPSLAPRVYAQLAEAMHEELTQIGGERRIVLGELAGFTSNSPHRTSIADFVAALPERVICMGSVWGVHAYVTHGSRPWTDPVASLEGALDARGACGRRAVVWITETGVGAEDPGQAITAEAGGEQAACQALAGALRRWYGNPRIKAVFQYTFREDTAYPVGLVSADLTHTYPVYYLWLAWSQALATHGSPRGVPAQCAR